MFLRLLVGLLVLRACVPFCANAECGPLRLGVILPLSGSAQAYGVAMQNGIEMALDEVGRNRIDVFYEDDEFTPAKSVAAFKKLTEVQRVDLVFIAASTPANAVAPLAERAGIPLVAWASDPRVARGRSLVIRSYVSGQQEGTRIAVEAIKRGYQRIAWISSTSDYANSIREGVVANVPKTTLLVNEEVPGDLVDFRSILLRVRAAKPDAIGVCVQPGQGGVLAKQARALGLRVPFFGCYYLADTQELASSGGALLGTWLVSDATTRAFHDRYLAKFQNDSVISAAALHFDLLHLVSTALPSCARGQGLVDELFRLGRVTDGAVGSYPLVRAEGDQYMALPLIVKRMTERGIEPEG